MKISHNLSTLSIRKLRDFFNSFDSIVCDCDGVIFFSFNVIDGVKEAITKLKDYGKTVKYVTNNTLLLRSQIAQKMTKQGVETDENDIINPSHAVGLYLKSLNFNKTAFTVAPQGLKNELKKMKMKVKSCPVPIDQFDYTEEAYESLYPLDEDIGAVVVGADPDSTYRALNYAFRHLYYFPDILFISTGYNDKIMLRRSTEDDNKVVMGKGQYVLGTTGFQDLLEKASERTSVRLGKPSVDFAKIVKMDLKCDPKRTLFIGDSLEQDIKFANDLGYQSLLVLTGHTTLENMIACHDDMKPDYYTKSIADFTQYLKQVAKK